MEEFYGTCLNCGESPIYEGDMGSGGSCPSCGSDDLDFQSVDDLSADDVDRGDS